MDDLSQPPASPIDHKLPKDLPFNSTTEDKPPKKDTKSKKAARTMKPAKWALEGLYKDPNEALNDRSYKEQDFIDFAMTLAEGRGLSLDQIDQDTLAKWRSGYFRFRDTHLEDPAITRLFLPEIQGKKFLGKGTLTSKKA